MNHADRIREKIAAGKLVKGFFLNMADPMVSEMAGYIGYDYVWIDAEHGPLDRQEIFHHIVLRGRAVPHLSECREWMRKP